MKMVIPFTDSEKRIFLSAMSREKTICEGIDKDGKSGSVGLSEICRGIERKVKDSPLWKDAENKEGRCEFCAVLEGYRRTDKIFAEKYGDQDLGDLICEYSIAIVKREYYQKGSRQNAETATDYGRHHKGYKLRFCPECGRKL